MAGKAPSRLFRRRTKSARLVACSIERPLGLFNAGPGQYRIGSACASMLHEMVKIAERSWQIWDPQALLASLREREQRSTTAVANGVAFPHPARRLPDALGESVVAFARMAEPLNLGAADNRPTDLVFMVACRNDATHLQVLARLSRLIMREELMDALRVATSPRAIWDLLAEAERAIQTTQQ
ncbi:MAG: PTS sugar transporter subunit IIA [Planctomycetes bacterium]|nr:PTS sugar transporter subunit IIA [Planctomycetota bacterium]